MKRIFSCLVLGLLILFAGCATTTERIPVRATVVDKYTGSKLLGKIIETTYNVKIEYDGIIYSEEDRKLYNLLEEGDRINAILSINKDDKGQIVNQYLSIID
jgi:hypothetical protein